MGRFESFRRALESRDRYQWLGFKHQLNLLYHDREKADDALRSAHADYESADKDNEPLTGADLDPESTTEVRAHRDAAIERERRRRGSGRSPQ